MNIKTNELQRYKKKEKSGYALPRKRKKAVTITGNNLFFKTYTCRYARYAEITS